MSNVIKLKNNNILGTIPTTSDLEAAELSINTASGRLYTKINDNEIIEVGPHPVFDTIAEAEAYFPLVGDICYINETSSTYKYVEYVSNPPTVNEKNILITGQGGNTRWIATVLSTTIAPMLKFFVGMTIEEPDSVITSNGTIVTLTVQAIGGGDINYPRPDGSIDTLDCTPPQTAALIAGTDSAYTTNWFYIDSTINSLVTNTTGFPTTEHVKLGKAILQSAASIQTYSKVMGGHNYSDHVFSPNDNGHGAHQNHSVRVRHGVYLDGLDFSHSGSGTATANIGIGVGKITQAHDHATPAFALGSDFIIVNQSFVIETNLYDILTDANDDTNLNRYAAYFIYIVYYEGGSNIYINKPSETYLSKTDAIEGVVYNYPSEFRGTMYPVHVLIARRSSSDIVIYDDASIDMRGKTVDAIAGGGAGIVPSHGDSHVNGTDDVPIVTASVKGLMPPNDQATDLATTGEPQFVKVSGNGGASGNLLLESTTDATKGKIYFGANSVYDEANDRFGIGTTSPNKDLSLVGTLEIVDPISTDSSNIYYQQPYFGRLNFAVDGNSGKSEVRYVTKGATAGTGQTYFVIASTESTDAGNNLLLGVANGRAFLTNAYNYAVSGELHLGGKSWIEDGAIVLDNVKNVGIGTSSISARLHAVGSTSDSSAYAVKINNSSGPALYVRNDKQVSTYGSRVKSYLIKTESYLIVDSDPEIIYYNTDAVVLTATLPASPTDGSIRFIKNTGGSSNDLTVARNGNLIDGAASDVVLPDGIGKYFQATTTGWQMI